MLGKESADNSRVTATAPGNLLLCGEYSILEKDGLGLALATKPFAEGSAEPSGQKDTSIHILSDGGSISLNAGMLRSKLPFIIKVFRSLKSDFLKLGYTIPSLDIKLSTEEFFKGRRKRGLGASAAATVILAGLVYAFLDLNSEQSANKPRHLGRDELAQLAVRAHRWAQGNRGSGYDVLTSFYGKAGIFLGGESPSWKYLNPNHPLWELRISIFQGPAEIDSKEAVQKYQHWKTVNPQESAKFFATSQKLLNAIKETHTVEELLRQLREYSSFAATFGEKMGVSSWISPPSSFFEQSAWKGSGAGNELGLLFLSGQSPAELSENYESVVWSRDGLMVQNL